MKDGELLFAEATANMEQKVLKERIKDFMANIEPLDILTEFVMKMRKELRETLIKEESEDVREKIIEKFNEDLHDFHAVYLEGLITMRRFEERSQIKVLSFLSLYVRYREFFQQIENKYEDFVLNKAKFGRTVMDFKEYLLSGWDVFVYLMPEPLHTMYDMVEISDDTVLEETDWDGTKEKRGKEIIRRNGECGGIVFAFVHVEEGNNEEGESVRIFYFYSISIDGKEMRYFRHEKSK